eukprot:78625_1
MSLASMPQKLKLHSTISLLTHHHKSITITRYFGSNITPGVDWAKRKKILRIRKYKEQQSIIEQSKLKKKKKIPIEEETEEIKQSEQPEQSEDIFLDQIINPQLAKTTFVKRKYEQIHGTPEKEKEYKFRPSLLTKMIKGTRTPNTLLTLWTRDKHYCPIDYINCSAAIVHLSQLSLEKLQPHQIYEKTMAWGVIRLIRDIMQFIDQFDMRQISNIMWSIGVLTSNNNDNIIASGIETSQQKIHRDFRRLTAKLINRFENDIEIRRKCNVQNMVDMLWTMNCVGLKVHKFFYQFCIDLYCKLDIDIGVTPDALAYLSVLYAIRIKLNEKIKIKPKKSDSETEDKGYLIYNEIIPKRFWMKLLKEFCDDFVLIEAEPHHVANILWSLGRIGNKYINNINQNMNKYGKKEDIKYALNIIEEMKKELNNLKKDIATRKSENEMLKERVDCLQLQNKLDNNNIFYISKQENLYSDHNIMDNKRKTVQNSRNRKRRYDDMDIIDSDNHFTNHKRRRMDQQFSG